MPSSSPARILGTAFAFALAFPLLHLVWALFSVPPLHDWPWHVAAGFLAGALVGCMPQYKRSWLSPVHMEPLAVVASVLLSSFAGLWAAALLTITQLFIWIANRQRMLSQSDPARRRRRDWFHYSSGDPR